MQREKFEDLYTARGFDESLMHSGLALLGELEDYCKDFDCALDEIEPSVLRSFVDLLILEDRNTRDHLLALARYFHIIDNKAIYIWFTGLFGSRGVIPQICSRLPEDSPLKNYNEAPLGMDLKKMPAYTKSFMEQLEASLPEPTYTKALAGNNHCIPREAMLEEKAFFDAAPSLETYLKERHQRKVAELQKHMEENRVWFEQIITPDVVDFVASNQEVLSGLVKDQWLYVTKIPFDTKGFLEAEDDNQRRYHVCHCPFVREGLKTGTLDVNKNWCYCSAGFAKYPFEVIFDQPLDVELLETPLKGDLKCRFRIKLPQELA